MSHFESANRRRFQAPRRANSATLFVSTALSLENRHHTDCLFDKIEDDVDGFNERTGTSGIKKIHEDNHTIRVRIGVNSVASKDPFQHQSSERESDRIRIKAELTVPVERVEDRFQNCANAVCELLEKLRWEQTQSTVSLTIDFDSTEGINYDFGEGSGTERGRSSSGFQAEAFCAKIRVKQVPIGKVEDGIEDLAKLVKEKSSD